VTENAMNEREKLVIASFTLLRILLISQEEKKIVSIVIAQAKISPNINGFFIYG
jgi:hypothetical protein